MTKLLASVCAAALTSGCALFGPAVPTTQISGAIAGQTFSIANPKDTTITSLSVRVGANGGAELTIGSLSSSNNSNVINSAYTGQASLVKETGIAIVNGVQAGVSAAAGAAK